jgi:hypothetical protein
MTEQVQNYIKALLKPNGKKPTTRRVWSIDLEGVLLPLFTATNTVGDTMIPHEALGAPLRLAYNADGTVKFSKTGRPVVKVVREIADHVRMMRENLVASLQAYTHVVYEDNPEGFKAEAQANQEAGKPIIKRDNEALAKSIAEAFAKAEAETEREREAVLA